MNFFDARVVATDGRKIVLDSEGLGRIEAFSDAEFIRQSAEVVVAVRPENFRLSTQADTTASGSVRGTLVTSAYLGDRSHFHVSVEAYPEPIAVAGLDSGNASRGSEVWLSWQQSSLLVLPGS